jgi:hypothetical protein
MEKQKVEDTLDGINELHELTFRIKALGELLRSSSDPDSCAVSTIGQMIVEMAGEAFTVTSQMDKLSHSKKPKKIPGALGR